VRDTQPSSAAPPFPAYPPYAPFPPYPPYPPVVIQSCCCHGSHGEPSAQQPGVAQPGATLPGRDGSYPPPGIAYPPAPATPANPVGGGRPPAGQGFNPFDPLGSVLGLLGLPAPVDPVSSVLGNLFGRLR
jgi:hypothetical protein